MYTCKQFVDNQTTTIPCLVGYKYAGTIKKEVTFSLQ